MNTVAEESDDGASWDSWQKTLDDSTEYVMGGSPSSRVRREYHYYKGCPNDEDVKALGPNSEHVYIISMGRDRFAVRREYALYSPIFAQMPAGPKYVQKGKPNYVRLSNVPSSVLAVIYEYLIYKATYRNTQPPDRIPPVHIQGDLNFVIDVLALAYLLDL